MAAVRTADLEDPTLDVIDAVYRAALAMDARLSRVLAPLRLSFPRWSVLRALAVRGPMSIQQVADCVGIHRTSARSLLTALAVSDYVAIHDDGTDRRCSRVVITDDGRAALSRGREMIIAAGAVVVPDPLVPVVTAALS